MVGSVIVALLAAMGIVLLVWCVSGSILIPVTGYGYTVLFVNSSPVSKRQVRAYLFLLRSGLSRLPLMVVDCGLSDTDRIALRITEAEAVDVRLFTRSQWEQYRETERETRVFGA